MLQLRFSVAGEERILPLRRSEIRFGRSGESDVVLPDYSVSRRHAALRRDGGEWYVADLESTNGVQLNGASVDRARIRPGDLLKIGIFEIRVEDGESAALEPDPRAPTEEVDKPEPADFVAPRERLAGRRPRPGAGDVSGLAAITNATIVRPLAEITAGFGLAGEGLAGEGLAGEAAAEKPRARDSTAVRREKREALDQAYASRVFGFLTRLARTLLTAQSDDEILAHVMEIAFETLPVDRGFILLRDPSTGELVCELMRSQGRLEHRPQGEVPISRTMLEAVMRERVALLTFDALSDQRLAGTESVRIHQIRAAMCTPLWSGEKIIGVMQLDTPHHTGSFTEPDVDLVATIANFCAVALERNRNAREAEYQRDIRARLERYHSPAVIEEVLHTDPAADEGIRSLKRAEVTVLFADIVGFTAFSENAAPEEVAELMEGYFTHAVEAIFAAGGTLDKFIGDCVMAFFGAPVPQEDHALRAVEAAIRICDDLDRWNAERRDRGLSEVAIRVALNSGPVVVGDVGSQRRVDYTVLGNTVNVASRLEQSVARPGDVVLGQETFRRLGGRVPCEPLGELQLKGLSQRTAAYRVTRP